MAGSILAVGEDPILLSTRVSLLNTRLVAMSAAPNDVLAVLAAKPIDLLILCHSIPESEAEKLVSTVRQEFPDTKILALEKISEDRTNLKVSATVATLDGPSRLLDAIEQLIR